MAVLIRIEERRCHSHHPLAAKGGIMRLKGSSFWCCLRNNTNNAWNANGNNGFFNNNNMYNNNAVVPFSN